MPEINQRDVQVAEDIGQIKGSLVAIEKTLAKLPCIPHAERLAMVETRSAFFGAIGGAIVMIGAKLIFWKS